MAWTHCPKCRTPGGAAVTTRNAGGPGTEFARPPRDDALYARTTLREPPAACARWGARALDRGLCASGVGALRGALPAAGGEGGRGGARPRGGARVGLAQ